MLRRVWPPLAERLRLSRTDAATVLAHVQERYSEPWRFYHNHSHIEELLSLSDQYRHALTDPDFVNLSIIFHDIVYYVDDRAPDNEKQSAVLFMDLLGHKINKDLADRVAGAIEATKSHSVPDSAAPDLKLFMDFDMAILGSSLEKYSAYAQNIRKEYSGISKDAYCEGRSGFFRNYLANTPSIFATSHFRDTREQSARDNIAWECGILETGVLVGEEGTTMCE